MVTSFNYDNLYEEPTTMKHTSSKERIRSKSRSRSRDKSGEKNETPKIGEDGYDIGPVQSRKVLFNPKTNEIEKIYYYPQFSNELRGGYKSKKYRKYKRKSRKISSQK
jgi:hypothetical protein